MSNYKKGDLVQHLPSGCVAKFDEMAAYNTAWFCAGDESDVIFRWHLSDCRPHRGPEPVIEAAVDVVNHWCATGEDIALCRMRKTVNEYLDAEKENDIEYKWLAMCEDKSSWLYPYKPEFDSDGDYITDSEEDGPLGNKEVKVPPLFLKPGQLWKRGLVIEDADPYYDEYCERWNGYWWGRVEDHGSSLEKLNNSDNPWITERRPTEDDADENGDVVALDHGISIEGWKQTVINGWVWQPVPQCLRVKPVEPKCEDCIHCAEHSEELWCCCLNHRFASTYGMAGCDYKPKSTDK